jgi:hypothetical protein
MMGSHMLPHHRVSANDAWQVSHHVPAKHGERIKRVKCGLTTATETDSTGTGPGRSTVFLENMHRAVELALIGLHCHSLHINKLLVVGN